MQDGLRVRKTIYMQNKGTKLGHGLQLAQEEKHHCICMSKTWIPKMI